MTNRSWFVPKPGYDGPPIELTCGKHTKDGRFRPKHVKLTPGISRLSRAPKRRFPMIGDPSQDERAIYEAAMVEKRRAAAPSDPLIGRVVELGTGCPTCGDTSARIEVGRGPHAAAALCQSCGKHRKWISQESYVATKEFLAETIARFGEPTSITLREEERPMKYDNTNSGALFKNTRRETDKHPEYAGTINVGGKDYWLNAWVKTSKAGQKFFSLSVKPKTVEKARPEFNDAIDF